MAQAPDFGRLAQPGAIYDLSAAAETRVAKVGTLAGRPAACSRGSIYFATDAAAGQNLHLCTSTDTWTQMTGSSGGGGYYETMAGAGVLGSGSNGTDRTQRAAMQGRDNLSFDDDGTRTILDFNALDPRVVWLDDEFFGYTTNSGSANIGTLGWRTSFNVAGATTYQQASGSDMWPNIGVLRQTTGAVAGNGGTLTTNGNQGASGQLGPLGSNANWGLVWVFRLTASTQERMRIGVGAISVALSTIDPANCFGLRFDTALGDTNFLFYVKGASGTDVTVDTGVAGDTSFHTLYVYSTTAGTLRMVLDGGVEKTFCVVGCDGTVTVPTAAMDPIAQLVTDTAAARSMDLDAFKFKARIAAGSAMRRN
jgi:hypothetical protein